MAEKEYIDARAFNSAILRAVHMYPSTFYNGLEMARKIAYDFPAADVRPVVTCADCKFWGRERISCEGLARCNTGESGIRYRNRNDFCSRGEKREES